MAFPSASALAQSGAQDPGTWNNAVRELAEKIATATGATRSISLDVRNISSLGVSAATSARLALISELTQRHFQIVQTTPYTTATTAAANAHVRVTFSEGIKGLVWVAEIGAVDGSNTPGQVVIVELSKPDDDVAHSSKDSLSISKKLVWEQADRFLDFAPAAPSGAGDDAILILEPARLVLYRSSNNLWALAQSVAIARPNVQPRDVSGHIDAASQKLSLTGTQCAGDLQQPQTLSCSAAPNPEAEPPLSIPGHEGSETVRLNAKCGDAGIVLTTGTGDWTQPDSIQGVEFSNSQTASIASSDPLRMDGPVISLSAPANESDAHAIVLNLTTNHYEGYIVTATCNR